MTVYVDLYVERALHLFNVEEMLWTLSWLWYSIFSIRPIVKSSIWKVGPGPGRFGLSKGISEVYISNASGIWDPQFEFSRIYIMRTDRKGLEGGSENPAPTLSL